MSIEATLAEILERVKAIETKQAKPVVFDEKPLTYEEAAEFLGVDYATVAKRASRGHYRRVGSPRCWRITKAELLNPTGGHR